MPHHEPTVTVTGEIAEIFAHRFVLRTDEGPVLADLGRKGAGKTALATGDRVTLTGRRKPSELKVAILVRGGETIRIDDDAEDDDRHHDRAPADPAVALAAVRALGHAVVAEPRRKPKHFEILARDGEGAHREHHVTLAGEIRKSKAGDPADGKWTTLRPAA